VDEDEQTWEGVLIYEITAKFVSTPDQPMPTDPDERGNHLRQVIEDAIKTVEHSGGVEIGGVRYAGSRGSKRYG
jgi:hypothetical protein